MERLRVVEFLKLHGQQALAELIAVGAHLKPVCGKRDGTGPKSVGCTEAPGHKGDHHYRVPDGGVARSWRQ